MYLPNIVKAWTVFPYIHYVIECETERYGRSQFQLTRFNWDVETQRKLVTVAS